MEQLVTEFEALELPVTLVCVANRHKEHNMVCQKVGFN
jgi:nitrate reductase (NAD(P)H)